jgi:hypothetical protein
MDTFAFVIPVLPGKEAADRQTMERFSTGEDRDAYVEAFRAKGLSRQAVWHQETPDGTVAVVFLEGEDVGRALGSMATSDEPFDRRWREFLQEVHGVDIANSPPPQVRLITDTRFDAAV